MDQMQWMNLGENPERKLTLRQAFSFVFKIQNELLQCAEPGQQQVVVGDAGLACHRAAECQR